MRRCTQAEEGDGRIRRKQIRCAFRFEGELYLILTNELDEDIVTRGEWNWYEGFTHASEYVSRSALDIAEKIVGLHTEDPARYPLVGEWYAAEIYPIDGRLRWRLKKTKPSTFSGKVGAVSYLLHCLVALACVAVVLVSNRSIMCDWLGAIWPFIPSSMLLGVACAVELAGSVLLFFLFRRERGALSLLCNACVPLGCIILVGMFNRYWWMRIVIPIVFLVGCLLAILYVGLLKGHDVKIGSSLKTATAILAFALVVISFSCELSARTYVAKPNTLHEMSEEEAMDELSRRCANLERQTWGTLTRQEKIDLLQFICDYECAFVLGCEPVTVCAGHTDRWSVLGTYCNGDRSVTIREQHLQNGGVLRVLQTALHETRHAYQHSLAEMYASLKPHIREEHENLIPFMQAQVYEGEINNYCSGEDDYMAYYEQEIEKDSRAWAKQRIQESYLIFIYE